MNVSKEENDIIGKRIEEIRRMNNLTQNEVAKHLEMKRSNYTATEIREDSRYFKDFQIMQLAKLFNVSSDYLLGLINDSSPKIEIKEINKKYGLTKNSLSILEEENSKNICNSSSVINTINYLLEDLNNNKTNSIIAWISHYLFTDIKYTEEKVFNNNNEQINTIVTDGSVFLSSLLNSINIQLSELRKEIKKEGEK